MTDEDVVTFEDLIGMENPLSPLPDAPNFEELLSEAMSIPEKVVELSPMPQPRLSRPTQAAPVRQPPTFNKSAVAPHSQYAVLPQKLAPDPNRAQQFTLHGEVPEATPTRLAGSGSPPASPPIPIRSTKNSHQITPTNSGSSSPPSNRPPLSPGVSRPRVATQSSTSSASASASPASTTMHTPSPPQAIPATLSHSGPTPLGPGGVGSSAVPLSQSAPSSSATPSRPLSPPPAAPLTSTFSPASLSQLASNPSAPTGPAITPLPPPVTSATGASLATPSSPPQAGPPPGTAPSRPGPKWSSASPKHAPKAPHPVNQPSLTLRTAAATAAPTPAPAVRRPARPPTPPAAPSALTLPFPEVDPNWPFDLLGDFSFDSDRLSQIHANVQRSRDQLAAKERIRVRSELARLDYELEESAGRLKATFDKLGKAKADKAALKGRVSELQARVAQLASSQEGEHLRKAEARMIELESKLAEALEQVTVLEQRGWSTASRYLEDT